MLTLRGVCVLRYEWTRQYSANTRRVLVQSPTQHVAQAMCPGLSPVDLNAVNRKTGEETLVSARIPLMNAGGRSLNSSMHNKVLSPYKCCGLVSSDHASALLLHSIREGGRGFVRVADRNWLLAWVLCIGFREFKRRRVCGTRLIAFALRVYLWLKSGTL